MSVPTLTPPPSPTPTRSITPTSAFNAAVAAFLAWLVTFVTQFNAALAWVDTTLAQMAAAASPDALSITYVFDTATADADPGNGKLRLGAATQNTATVIRVDLLDTLGADWTAALDQLDASSSAVKGYVRLVKVTDGSKWLLFSLSARAAPSGYRNLTVTCVAAAAANPFAAGDLVDFEFTRTGDKGDIGLTPWGTAAAWATATAYTANAPASLAVQGGETYLCLVSHTSGTFATDLAAGKWLKVAAKGNDGSANAAPDVIVEDQQATGTAGASIAASSFAAPSDVRLNTLLRNINSIASLSGNAVTLPAGTYYFEGVVPVLTANAGGHARVRLYNATDGAEIQHGRTLFLPYLISDSEAPALDVAISGLFTLAASKAVKLQVGIDTSSLSWTMGIAAFQGTEIYSQLKFWKVA